jgi:hypothetical protein
MGAAFLLYTKPKYKMNINRDAVNALELDDSIKKNLLELFDEIETKENEISAIKAKVPADSQKIVDEVDYKKFQDATKELSLLKEKLAKEIETPQLQAVEVEQPKTFLNAFQSFFE